MLLCCLSSEVTLSSYKSVRAINKLSALAKTSDVTARLIVVTVPASHWLLVTRPGLSLVRPDTQPSSPGVRRDLWSVFSSLNAPVSRQVFRALIGLSQAALFSHWLVADPLTTLLKWTLCKE